MAPKEAPQHLAGQKFKSQSESESQNQKQKQMQAKVKRGSVLSAIEDIQRMSSDAIVQEFDRMVEHTERHFIQNERTHLPCTKVEAQLLRCLRQHYQESYMCFHVMEEYRQCVGLATQAYVDRIAEQDERLNPKLLPVVPPKATMPSTALPTINEEVRTSKRSWLKPWTWLR